MSKQAMIKIAEDFLRTAWKFGVDNDYYHFQVAAQNLIDRIAPLREFPEEEFRKIARQYRKAQNEWLTGDRSIAMKYNFGQMIADYKRLWEQHPPSLAEIVSNIPPEKRKALDEKIDNAIRQTEGGNILEQDKPKGTCRKCGGSGVIEGDFIKGRHGKHMSFPCPDCGGTGEERKYCLRCGAVCSEDSVATCFGTDMHRWTDQRSGGERRVWQRRKRDVGRREMDRSDSHTDRRTRTRRKAVSGDG